MHRGAWSGCATTTTCEAGPRCATACRATAAVSTYVPSVGWLGMTWSVTGSTTSVPNASAISCCRHRAGRGRPRVRYLRISAATLHARPRFVPPGVGWVRLDVRRRRVEEVRGDGPWPNAKPTMACGATGIVMTFNAQKMWWTTQIKRHNIQDRRVFCNTFNTCGFFVCLATPFSVHTAFRSFPCTLRMTSPPGWTFAKSVRS